jgi:hypothetical protein
MTAWIVLIMQAAVMGVMTPNLNKRREKWSRKRKPGRESPVLVPDPLKRRMTSLVHQ